MNKQQLTEQYYCKLNEGVLDWLNALMPLLIGGGKAVAGLYGLDQLLDFGKEIIKTGASSSNRRDFASERIDAMTNPNMSPGERTKNYYKALSSDERLNSMSRNDRTHKTTMERAAIAKINRENQKSAREAAFAANPEIAKAQKAYEEAKKNEKPGDRGTTVINGVTVPGKSSQAVKDAYDKLKKLEQEALAGSKEYKAAKALNVATEMGGAPIQPVERTGPGFTVGKSETGSGMPVIVKTNGPNYRHPGSAGARVQAEIDAGRMGDPNLWSKDKDERVAPGQGVNAGKLPMDLEAEQKAAGLAARDASIKADTGVDTTGMSQEETRKAILDRKRKQNAEATEKMKKEIAAEQNPTVGVGPLNDMGLLQKAAKITNPQDRADVIRSTAGYKEELERISKPEPFDMTSMNNRAPSVGIPPLLQRPLSTTAKSNILKSMGKLKTSTIKDRDAIKSKMTDEWLDTMRKASKI